MQRKTQKLSVNASKLEMNDHNVSKVNAEVNSPISLGGEDTQLTEAVSFAQMV